MSSFQLKGALVAIAITMVANGVRGFHLPTASTSRSHATHGSSLLLGLTIDNDAEIIDSREPQSKTRRDMIQQSTSAIASILLSAPSSALAEDDTAGDGSAPTATRQPSEPFTRSPSPNDKFKFSYTVTPPPSFVGGNKPLKTHLDEINFSAPDTRGYTLGITVDPVRISKIQEFGTPEEVAARVVTAEINRDGVFKVTLAKDPKEDASAGCYDIEYISDGKRGVKRFVTRIYVRDGFLYVLTAQSKEAEYDTVREADILECVQSFKPL